jgi:hypothetical protein
MGHSSVDNVSFEEFFGWQTDPIWPMLVEPFDREFGFACSGSARSRCAKAMEVVRHRRNAELRPSLLSAGAEEELFGADKASKVIVLCALMALNLKRGNVAAANVRRHRELIPPRDQCGR